MKKIALIVAAGTGSRMGAAIPKQFILLEGRPMLYYTIKAFLDAYDDLQVVLVVHPDQISRAKDLLIRLSRPLDVRLVEGGATRYESVRAGLAVVPEESIVFVHDGARCLVSVPLIRKCFEEAVLHGNAVPAISAVDTLRIVKGTESQLLDRSLVRIVQTPQTFLSSILRQAYELPGSDKFTDDASVAEHAGVTINLIEGDPANIKVTHPIDLAIAEKLLGQNRRS